MRLAEPGDADAVVELTARAYAPYTEAYGYPPVPVTEDYAPRIGAGEVWLLEETGRLVGLIVLEDVPSKDGLPPAALQVFSVAIEPEQQGKGLGTRLLGFAEEQVLSRGRDVLTLYTNARMTRNIALYRRLGFEETGRRSNPLRPGWTRVDMEKRLAPSVTRRSA